MDKNKDTVIVYGNEGFIGSYVTADLLNNGYNVVGVDNLTKYGPAERSFHGHPNYERHVNAIQEMDLMKELIDTHKPKYLINLAAIIGGIGYFHIKCYDLMRENESIAVAYGELCDYAYLKVKCLDRAIHFSSSMVFDASEKWPSEEGDMFLLPPPRSAYGFQKLAIHYHAESQFEQYGIPYSIIIPFNAIGTGELKPKDSGEILSKGEKDIALSHVVPDFISKIINDEGPLKILGTGEQIRCYTSCKDIARGTRMVMESPEGKNETFNIGVNQPLKVKDLGKIIWDMLRPDEEYKFILQEGFTHDIQRRAPDMSKTERVIGFKVENTLEDELTNEIIPWMKKMIKLDLV